MSIRRITKVLALLLALGLVAAACGSDGDDGTSTAAGGDSAESTSDDAIEAEPASDRGGVAYFSYANFNGFSQGIWTGVQEGADAAGVEAEIFDGAFDFSGETQAQQIQNATLSGDFDTFVISSNNGAALIPGVEEAIAEGIAVVAVFAPIGPDFLTLDPQIDGLIFAGQSTLGAVEAQVDLVIEACEGINPCNVQYLIGIPTLDLDVARTEHFEMLVNAEPNLVLLDSVAGGYSVEEGIAAGDAVFLAQDEVDVMVGSAQAILGAEEAAIAAGIDDIAFIGAGSPTQAVEAVNEGRWFGLQVDRTADWGRIAVEVAGEQLAGNNPNPSIDLDELGDLFVTQETIGDFEGQWTN